MTIPRSAPWTAQEIAALRAYYPTEGHNVARRLPGLPAVAGGGRDHW